MAKKQPVIRIVKSLMMASDPVGNVLLLKMTFEGNKHACVIMPAHIVFWLIKHFPINQDPNLQAPLPLPQIYQEDWEEGGAPRVATIQCKQFADAIRMTLELENYTELTVLLNRSNVELLRQIMVNHQPNLMDLGVF